MHSYEFLRMQMRKVKREVSKERQATIQQPYTTGKKGGGHSNSAFKSNRDYSDMHEQGTPLRQKNSMAQPVPGPNMTTRTPMEQRATSLPKIAGKLNTTAQLRSARETVSNLAMSKLGHTVSKMDHQHLMDIKVMLERQQKQAAG